MREFVFVESCCDVPVPYNVKSQTNLVNTPLLLLLQRQLLVLCQIH